MALAVAGASAVAYAVTRHELRSQVDELVMRRARVIATAPRAPGLAGAPGPALFGRGRFGAGGLSEGLRRNPFAELDTFFQIIAPNGRATRPAEQLIDVPVQALDRAVAAGRHGTALRDQRVGGVHLRVVTMHRRTGGAVQVSHTLTDVDRNLRRVGLVLAIMSLAGIALGALLGRRVAHRTLRPVTDLTAAAERVAETQDLSATIALDRNDEVGRLAHSFNAMLAALSESRAQQHRLVTDASHELRTPLTSLRTNVELLARNPEMSADEFGALMRDVTTELEELTSIVAELVELATDAHEVEEPRDVQLDEVVERVVARARRRMSTQIELHAMPSRVRGRPTLLERAAANVLDNACKWAPTGSIVDVRVGEGVYEVRDRGAGIDAADLPLVFERFYRAEAAQSMPGSGLGLAIVREIIEREGGDVWARNAPDGGAVVGFSLPTLDSDGADESGPKKSLSHAPSGSVAGTG